MSKDVEKPQFGADAFNCPFCGAYANQIFASAKRQDSTVSGASIDDYSFSVCSRCGNHALWVGNSLVYPDESPAPDPVADMPEHVIQIYNEARAVVRQSPRAAAALLRLATEMLLEEIGADGDGPYEMIGDLVQQGKIDERVQQAYDSLRVYGNESVHPGTINIDDREETARDLFELMNFIVRRTISDEEFVQKFYAENVPEGKKEGIKNRDSSTGDSQ